jgi:hypothetical protein
MAATLADCYNIPPPEVTRVWFRIIRRPGKIRVKFARELYSLGMKFSRSFHGYIRRTNTTQLEGCIVTEVPEITLNLRTTEDSELLQLKFQVCQPDGEPDGWSNRLIDYQDNDESAYSVVSSIR